MSTPNTLESIIADVDAVNCEWESLRQYVRIIQRQIPDVGQKLFDYIDGFISVLANHVNHAISFNQNKDLIEACTATAAAMLKAAQCNPYPGIPGLSKDPDGVYRGALIFFDPDQVSSSGPGGRVEFEEEDVVDELTHITLHNGQEFYLMGNSDEIGEYIARLRAGEGYPDNEG